VQRKTRIGTLGSALVTVLLITVAAVYVASSGICQAQPAGPEQAMSDDKFWALIERTVADESDPLLQLESLAAALNELSPDDIEAFDAAFWRQMNRAYTWDLWGAAYVVHGGASDDGFEYFRRWLISKGRSVFERVLANPDELADLLVPNLEGVLEFEEFAYVAGDVWTRRTGRSIEEFAIGVLRWTADAGPWGAPFEEDESWLSSRYPKLWRRFGENPLM
jgi:hypothetical protein